MELLGPRIKLLPLNDSDFELFVEIRMNSEMMTHVYEPLTKEEAIEAFQAQSKPWRIDSDDWLAFGITDSSTGEKLGSIGLKIVNHKAKIAEVGFMVKQSAQGKGIAGESLSLIKEYAFKTLDLNKLVALCSINNPGSYKLLEKSSFVREGCLQQNTLVNKQYIDDYTYGLCRSNI